MLWTKQQWPQSVLTEVKSGSYDWLHLQVQCNVSLKKQFQLGSRFQFDWKLYVSIIITLSHNHVLSLELVNSVQWALIRVVLGAQ